MWGVNKKEKLKLITRFLAYVLTDKQKEQTWMVDMKSLVPDILMGPLTHPYRDVETEKDR